MKECSYIEGHKCKVTICPTDCDLPRRCETCGNSTCIYYDTYEGNPDPYCWIPPFWSFGGKLYE